MKKGIAKVLSLVLALDLMLSAIPIAQAAVASISLNGNSISVSGDGVTVENNVALISQAGTYTVSGTLNEGRIIVEAKGCDVKLILNGVNITCSYGSPIYIFKAASAEISLAEGTSNVLTDGKTYTYDDNYSSLSQSEPNACLYSKADLIISGGGKLTVNGNHNNGITSKDTLTVNGANITVTAEGNGINGKDSFFAKDAVFTVNAKGGDALRSTQENDPSLGWITLNNCNTDLTAANDGIQSETGIIISGGIHSIMTGGGYEETLLEGESAKGIKAGTTLSLNVTAVTVSSSDDAIHAGGEITLDSGDWQIHSGDDGIHSDTLININGGEIFVYTLGKGIDGVQGALQNGGNIQVASKDSGLFNKSGGFTFNKGTFLGISDRDTVLEPNGTSFGIVYDTEVSGDLKVWDKTWSVPFAVKYVLVATDNTAEKTVIDFGGNSIEATLTDGFTLYTEFNSSYTPDDSTMTLLGVKADTPASAIGMAVYRDGTALTDTDIVATGDTVIMGGKEYTVIIKGDANGDGKVNGTDFMQVRRHFLGLFEISETNFAAADVNGDSNINGTDFMQIRRHFLGTFDLFA